VVYILGRLDRDGHVELAAQVRSGRLSANAAAIQAGWRKKRERRKLSALEQVLKLVPRLTFEERAVLIDLLRNDESRSAASLREYITQRREEIKAKQITHRFRRAEVTNAEMLQLLGDIETQLDLTKPGSAA
jgi:hypothetical protein